MLSKKEKYELLQLKTVSFASEDIITASMVDDEYLDEELDGEWGD